MTAVLSTLDTPNRAAVCATAYVRLLDALRELAEQCNPLDVHPEDVLDKLPHLARGVAVELFSSYAEAVQEAGTLDPADHSAETYVRREELGRDVRARLDAMLEGHPYAPAWGGPAHADPVYLAGMVTRFREDAEDYRRQRDAAERRATRTVREREHTRELETANASLVQLTDDLRDALEATGYRLTPAGDAELDGCSAATASDVEPAGAEVVLFPDLGASPLALRLGTPEQIGTDL